MGLTWGRSDASSESRVLEPTLSLEYVGTAAAVCHCSLILTAWFRPHEDVVSPTSIRAKITPGPGKGDGFCRQAFPLSSI